MAVENLPEYLVQTGAAYQRDVASIHLDTPPGDTREARLAEAMAQRGEAYTTTTIEALQSQLTAAPASHQETLKRRHAWALAMHVRSALLPMQREIQTRQRMTVCLVDDEPIPLHASFSAMAMETRRERRAAIEAAVVRQLGDLNELFEAQFKALTAVAEPLGYASPEALWSAIMPVQHKRRRGVKPSSSRKFSSVLARRSCT